MTASALRLAIVPLALVAAPVQGRADASHSAQHAWRADHMVRDVALFDSTLLVATRSGLVQAFDWRSGTALGIWLRLAVEAGEAPEPSAQCLDVSTAGRPLTDQALERYPATDTGDATPLERAFPDAPPQIPHAVEDMLPITADDNECPSCHHPDNATGPADSPLPKSHFSRAVMGSGKKRDPQVWMVKKDEAAKDVVGSRYNCDMCHTPQASDVGNLPSRFVPLPREAGQPAD